jgi:hypothetical protein
VLWPVIAVARRRYERPFAYVGARAMAFRLVRAAAVVGLAAVVLWFVVLTEVSSTNGAPVDLLLHLAQALAFVGFVGGVIAAVWNLILAIRTPGAWLAKLFAVLATLAFAMMLWIALTYHLIGVSGQY